MAQSSSVSFSENSPLISTVTNDSGQSSISDPNNDPPSQCQPKEVVEMSGTENHYRPARERRVSGYEGVWRDSLMMDLDELRGTQTKLSASVNIAKCICGAGSFALPHVLLKEGVAGGVLAMFVCGFLSTYTMQSLNKSRMMAKHFSPDSFSPPQSYVELTELALGKKSSNIVFALTLFASLGISSTYIAFIGQTLASLSCIDTSDEGASNSSNIIHAWAPDVSETSWKVIATGIVLPLSLIRDYGIFAFTSALGVVAVIWSMLITLIHGIATDPGGGIAQVLSTLQKIKLWPDSIPHAFGGSFGTIAYLFGVHLVTFPIINSMKNPKRDYNGAVSWAVMTICSANILFSVLCLGFYGEETKDLVVQNLDSSSQYLSALKLLLCVDLLFTFPILFGGARQILESALIKAEDVDGDIDAENEGFDSLKLQRKQKVTPGLIFSRAAVTTAAVGVCLALSQIGGFGALANLVGGVACGTLAFIFPPAIEIALSRRVRGGAFQYREVPQWLIAGFGVSVVTSVTYFTLFP